MRNLLFFGLGVNIAAFGLYTAAALYV